MAPPVAARVALLFAVAYNHALRASEATQLIVDNVSEHGIRIRGLKKGETVTQPLIEHPKPLLSERQALFDFLRGMTENQRVFGIGRHRFWELMQHYGEQLNLPDEKRHPHCLRHTCGTDLRAKEVPLEDIQAWMRHKSLGSTGVYLRPTQQQVNAAVLAGMGAKTEAQPLIRL